MLHKRFEELRLSGNLPSSSGVGLAILRETQGDDASIEDLIRSIQTDPALTGRLLKLANGARRAGPEPATSVTRAAAHLGVRAVRRLALGFTLVSSKRSGVCASFAYERYWSLSLACALAARNLARRSCRVDPEEAFTLGLLSRVGMLALASVHPEAYGRILDRRDPRSSDLLAAETEAFGIHHWEVTASMMAEWGFSELFTNAILFFGEPNAEHAPLNETANHAANDTGNDTVQRMVSILGPAARIAELLAAGGRARAEDPAQPWCELVEACRPFGQAEAWIRSVCEESARQWQEWGALFNLPTRTDHGFASLPAGIGPIGADLRSVLEHVPEVDPGPEVTDEEAAPHSPPASCRAPIRILVVDDDPRIVKLVSFHLEHAGYQVISAGDGREGLDIALRESPEMVVTDWLMPELSGLELCRLLRATDSGRRTYVLMLTAREDEERIVDAFNAGADDYVTKPFNPRILLARVQAGQRLILLQRQVDADQELSEQQLAEMGLMTRRLQAAALTDVLTELPNRRYAVQRLEQEWAMAVRLDRPLSVVMIDIDHFKRINDRCGHDIGDLVLESTAALLRAQTRRGDVVCRWGGEEFLVINVNSDLDGAWMCAERLRTAVASHLIECEGFHGRVTVSLGIAERQGSTPDFETLIRLADRAVYEAKSAGRNAIRGGPPGALPETA